MSEGIRGGAVYRGPHPMQPAASILHSHSRKD